MTDKPKLAKKQKRVLDLLTKGKSPGQVAKAMKISVNGVYGHMRRIEAKGYTVPRSGTPSPTRKRAKASTNGSGPVAQIDAGIAKLIEQAEDRAKKIKVESDEIRDEQKTLDARLAGLGTEHEALLARRKALTSV